MDYSDWLIILSAMILITFLTLLGLALLERDLKKNTVFLWISVAGLIVFIIITGVLIWYYHKKEPTEYKKIENTGRTDQTQKIDINEIRKSEERIDEEKDLVR